MHVIEDGDRAIRFFLFIRDELDVLDFARLEVALEIAGVEDEEDAAASGVMANAVGRPAREGWRRAGENARSLASSRPSSPPIAPSRISMAAILLGCASCAA